VVAQDGEMSDFRNIEAALRSGEDVSFSFGKNWAKYLRGLTEAKLQQAERSLAESFANESLEGQSFLDAGCGSGVFSLAALRLGAREVTSVDVDPNSVACARHLCAKTGSPEIWTCREGSILDPTFVRTITPASRVYTWGVLHHTGAMWDAIDSVLTRVQPGGLLCIALYVEPRRAELQLKLKRLYNRSPRSVRFLLEGTYASLLLGYGLVRQGRNPVRYVREYGARSRGMSFWRDVADWLGGLPCEWADPEEVSAFVEARGFETVRVIPGSPGGNAEYLFRRSG
jgi:SAM-dependent methyltransferase